MGHNSLQSKAINFLYCNQENKSEKIHSNGSESEGSIAAEFLILKYRSNNDFCCLNIQSSTTQNSLTAYLIGRTGFARPLEIKDSTRYRKCISSRKVLPRYFSTV